MQNDFLGFPRQTNYVYIRTNYVMPFQPKDKIQNLKMACRALVPKRGVRIWNE